MIPFENQLILFCNHLRLEKTELYEKVRDLGIFTDGRIYSLRECGVDFTQEEWDIIEGDWIKFSEAL